MASEKDKAEWNDFVSSHPRASPCQLFEWSSILGAAYGKKSYFLLLEGSEGAEGVLPLILMRGPLAGNRLVSMPFLDLGGVLASSSQGAHELWQASLQLANELRVKGVELRGGTLIGNEDRGEATRVRFLLPLPDSEEQLWKQIGSKVRNQIRKSEKEGLETRTVGAEGLSSFYRIFARNMRDLGSPVHSRSLFEEILSNLDERANLYLTFGRDGTPVAGGVCLSLSDTAVVPWASSLRSARSSCPNHSLYWRILRDVQAGGARVFDFGRSSVGSGTYRFKKQWGGQVEPLRWRSFTPSGEPLAEKHLDPRRHSALADLWRRLPYPLASSLGPRIRRHLAN